MAKGQNTKAVAANEKKAAANAEKSQKQKAAAEAEEAAEWAEGSKQKAKSKEDQEKKRLEALEAKRLREEMLAAEEASLPARGVAKKAVKKEASFHAFASTTDSFAASNLDDALDLMTAIKQSGGSQNQDKVERHPERRLKSAWAQFEEEQLPILKKENPGLKLSQLNQKLQKIWKKSPQNPLNQQSVAYNASKGDIQSMVESATNEVLERLRV